VSPAWDVWAIGVIAFEMLAARHPFRREISLAGADSGILSAGPAGGSPEMSAAAAAFFRTVLSPDLAVRPSAPLEFLETCERVLM
jgi:serine/threonine protein kinase